MKFKLAGTKSPTRIVLSLFLGIITSLLIKDGATLIILAGKNFNSRSFLIQIGILAFLFILSSLFFFLIITILNAFYSRNEKLQKMVIKIGSLMNRYLDVLFPIFIFSITLIVAGYCSTMGVDPHHDGIMLKPALDMASGKSLFIETFTQYGALTTIIQALALKIFGSYLITIRLLTAFFYGLISLLLYFIFKRFLPKLILLISLLIWLFMAPYYGWIFHPWSSVYALFFQLLTTYLLIIYFERKSQRCFILASISTALIFWCRQPVGVFTFLAIIAFFTYLFLTRQIKKQIYIKCILIFLFINILVSFIFIIYFVINNSLIDWWKQSILFAYVYGQIAGTGFNLLNSIGILFPPSKSSLSIWTLIPISTLLLLINNHKNKLLVLPIFIGLASWLQYFPISDIRHTYWAATPLIPLYCLFIYQFCQRYIFSSFHLDKNMFKCLAILIIILSFLPDLSYRIEQGLIKLNATYQYIDQPAVLKGMKIVPNDAKYFQNISQIITNYFDKNPKGNVVTNDADALYLTFDSRIYNIHPMYVYWNSVNDSIYPDFPKTLKNYLETEKPLLISAKEQVPQGYCPLDDNQSYKFSVYQSCPAPK